MALKSFRPLTPARRFMTVRTQDGLNNVAPEKSLLAPLKKSGGRNFSGTITSRHRGGGHKRRYRVIDFKRNKHGVPAIVQSIEYDPNRSAFIALLQYADGEKRYILAPKDVSVGDKLNSGHDIEVRPGNAMPLAEVPIGSWVHNIELKPGKGGQLVRSAGVSAQLVAIDGNHAVIKLPSGEMRKVHKNCIATIGVLSNSDHGAIVVGKAGKSRWLGIRPQTRGMAMNPKDHPHGGGEGRSKSGHHPVSPWGKPCKGFKTRKRNKYSSNSIISRRK
ncbi:MAG: 50S ribosomal protein L2 [Candidatus Cloacimonetes bacterium]|nr:50S ribosomal protein L2 [Candidatus Cloacimonadota bacterium]